MLALFETPAGYALFKVLDKSAVDDSSKLQKAFSSPENAASIVKLKAFSRFTDITKALAGAAAICDNKLDKGLKKFLKQVCVDKPMKGKLAVYDAKLGGLINKKLGLPCIYNEGILELMRGIRLQMDNLITGLPAADVQAMKLGLSHSLSRYKIKFSPDKVDVMIIQAISLLDELDKELNTYSMRVREWYGWHFPEMGKIITDNQQYAKVVRKMGVRFKCSETDFSDILDEDQELELKEAAEVSMGTEIADEDTTNILSLCDQVINIHQYRASLYDYLRNRMNAIAPNLTVMVGELVGARLIAHAGSLMSLAKHPASTVQILGAEKALFRALKTKHDTPKYGLIYHASLVGQAAPKNKGKISRILATKTALSIRQDALGDTEGVSIGHEYRAKVEDRLRQLEGGAALSGNGSSTSTPAKHVPAANTATYNDAADVTMESAEDTKAKKKKAKKAKKAAEAAAAEEEEKKAKKAKKNKRKAEEEPEEAPGAKKNKKSKKKKSKTA